MKSLKHVHTLPKTILFVSAIVLSINIQSFSYHVLAQKTEAADPAEITSGERLFLETRFAQFSKSYLDNGGDANTSPTQGDPSLDKVVNWQNVPIQFADGPFAGQSMNCRSCHFVDEIGVEEDGSVNYGMRTYSDFARRSPVPAREDGKTVTVRNSPPLVNASLPRKNFLQHFDAEFKTLQDLVESTLSGRNYGWVPGEAAQAIAHVARIIREDDGTSELAREFESLSYSTLLTGTDPNLPDEFVLSEEFRVDVATATDKELFEAVAKLIAAYTEDLAFSQDDDGNFNLSPYDVFLETNNLPQQPRKWEFDISYSKRLLRKIKRLEQRGQLQFVSENPNFDGKFEFHPDQTFVFGEQQLQGMKIFFTRKHRRLQPSQLAEGKIGNCISCHAAPNFTDFKFHNTGIAQAEYDGIHGVGAFAQLDIPGLRQRNQSPDEFLPASEQHPNAKEPFRSVPLTTNAQLTDLGLWNIFANPDFPKPQIHIWRVLCKEALRDWFRSKHIFRVCRPSYLLSRSIALFKTPGLRDLGHSAPYSHTGQADTLEDVIRGYINNSNLARSGDLRNGDTRISQIGLIEQDIEPLVAFLKSLNEDYN